MIHSKLIEIPILKRLPSTDAADVKENIDNWLERKLDSKIATFLTKKPHEYKSFHRGYRFITDEDLEENIKVVQKIIGVKIEITFHRKVHSPDHFCPLYFAEDHERSYVSIKLPNKEVFIFKSDNNLKIKLREYKKSLV